MSQSITLNADPDMVGVVNFPTLENNFAAAFFPAGATQLVWNSTAATMSDLDIVFDSSVPTPVTGRTITTFNTLTVTLVTKNLAGSSITNTLVDSIAPSSTSGSLTTFTINLMGTDIFPLLSYANQQVPSIRLHSITYTVNYTYSLPGEGGTATEDVYVTPTGMLPATFQFSSEAFYEIFYTMYRTTTNIQFLDASGDNPAANTSLIRTIIIPHRNQNFESKLTFNFTGNVKFFAPQSTVTFQFEICSVENGAAVISTQYVSLTDIGSDKWALSTPAEFAVPFISGGGRLYIQNLKLFAPDLQAEYIGISKIWPCIVTKSAVEVLFDFFYPDMDAESQKNLVIYNTIYTTGIIDESSEYPALIHVSPVYYAALAGDISIAGPNALTLDLTHGGGTTGETYNSVYKLTAHSTVLDFNGPTRTIGSNFVGPVSIATTKIDLSGSTIGYQYENQSPASLACLLKGTTLYDAGGLPIPIESVLEGSIVLTTAGPKRVLNVGHWVVPWEARTHMNNKAMFRVEKGTLGASEPVYLSYWHQVRCADGVMRPAAASRLPRARKEELCEPGSSVYHLYHVAVEDYVTSHLIVNGSCIVESWSGGEAKQTDPKIEVARPAEELVSF